MSEEKVSVISGKGGGDTSNVRNLDSSLESPSPVSFSASSRLAEPSASCNVLVKKTIKLDCASTVRSEVV